MLENDEMESPNLKPLEQLLMQLLVLSALWFGSMLLGNMVISPLAELCGMSNMTLALEEIGQGKHPSLKNPLRVLFLLMHVFVYIVPSMLFVKFYWARPLGQALYLNRLPRMGKFAQTFLLMACAVPASFVVLYLNYQIPSSLHSQPSTVLKVLLQMDSPTELILNLVWLGAAAAIGEEFLFRGILQRIFAIFYQNIHAAIWTSAIIFSLIHGELQAFLPRLMLGAVLGYSFYWTSSLWGSILIHLTYNALQVVAIYLQAMPADAEPTLTMELLIASAIGAGGVVWLYQRLERRSSFSSLLANNFLQKP